MNDTTNITAYRAAAAKLAEALALGACTRAYYCVEQARHLLDPMQWDAAVGVRVLRSFPLMESDPRAWRWNVEALRLRLLVEAMLLEQQSRRIPTTNGRGYVCPDCHGWLYACQCEDVPLAALVREWRGGVT